MAERARGLSELDLDRDGATLYRGAAAGFLDTLKSVFARGPSPGRRIKSLTGLENVLGRYGQIGKIAARHLGPASHAVRAIAFDKTEGANWSLGWHQDRTICVKRRIDLPGFGPWSVKQGIPHVEPPFDLLDRMLTVRIHVDAVDFGNAPLRIALGSHASGLIPERDILPSVERADIHECLAEAGDAWVYRTSILHASERARSGQRRRVLQVDYSGDDLPDGMEWFYDRGDAETRLS
jgi:ectoine hydroxylase-related dioxygenase (phytanoyl-CoA dioxygenase family)